MTRQMKDSHVEWIGEIPSNWQVKKVKHNFLRKKGKSESGNFDILTLARSGIKTRDISTGEGQIAADYSNYNLVVPGDILINPMDLVSGDNSNISEIHGVISPAYVNLQANHDTNPYFYNYYFKLQYWLGSFFTHGKGVSYVNRWTLNDDAINNFPIVYPSKDEQEKIVQFLDEKLNRISELVKDTQQSVEELKKYKQSLITEVVTKGLDKDIEMKDSGVEWIGKTPVNWKILRIKNILNEKNEKSVTGDEEPLSMSQKFGLIPSKDMDNIPNAPASYIGNKKVGVNDLVFNKLKAHLGVFAVSNYDGIVSPDYAVYQSKNGIDVKYLEFLFKTPQAIAEFIKYSKGVGAGLTRLYTYEFFNIKVSIPDLEEQMKIVKYLNNLNSNIDSLIIEKQKIMKEYEQYKRSLIYEYVTGKKQV